MASKNVVNNQVILEEIYNENYQPTDDDLYDYAKIVGIDPQTEPHLLWIAREGLKAPLPENWKACKELNGDLREYYFNFATGESIWDHPCDEYYQKMVIDERKKKGQAGKEEGKKKKDKQNKQATVKIGFSGGMEGEIAGSEGGERYVVTTETSNSHGPDLTRMFTTSQEHSHNTSNSHGPDLTRMFTTSQERSHNTSNSHGPDLTRLFTTNQEHSHNTSNSHGPDLTQMFTTSQERSHNTSNSRGPHLTQLFTTSQECSHNTRGHSQSEFNNSDAPPSYNTVMRNYNTFMRNDSGLKHATGFSGGMEGEIGGSEARSERYVVTTETSNSRGPDLTQLSTTSQECSHNTRGHSQSEFNNSDAPPSYNTVMKNYNTVMRNNSEFKHANIKMSWDNYLDILVAKSKDAGRKAQVDKACIIGLDGGVKWTTDGHANALKLSATESSEIAKCFKNKDFSSCQSSGVHGEGTKYQFLREVDSKIVYAKRKGCGALTLQASKTSVVIGHTKEGCQQGNANKAVAAIAEYLESLDM